MEGIGDKKGGNLIEGGSEREVEGDSGLRRREGERRESRDKEEEGE